MKKIKILFVMLLILIGMNLGFSISFQVLNSNPSPIQAGEYADITIRIDTFLGTDSKEIKNLKIYPKETEFIKPIPGNEINIAILNSGQSLTRTFRIYFNENIPSGNIPLTLIFEQDGTKFEQSQMIYVFGGNKKPEILIGSIKSIPDKLLEDTKSNKISIILQNLGDKSAELLIAEIKTNNSIIEESYYYSLRDSVSELKGAQQVELNFIFDILETDLKQIPVELFLRYRVKNVFNNSYSIVEEIIPFEIRLSKSPKYEIIEIEKENIFQAGSSGNNLKITIKNIGEEEGNTVRLRLYPDPSAPFDFERTSIFISSSIKTGEIASFIVPFDIINSAINQTYYINVELESLVGSNRYFQKERIEISVDKLASNNLSTYLYSLVIFSLFVALLIGIFYSRKNK